MKTILAPFIFALNLALVPYCVLRDFDSPPKPRWMKRLSWETWRGEPDLKGAQRP